MQSLLVILAVCFGATFAYVPLDFFHSQDNAADKDYPLTSSQYMKWILDRQSAIVDDSPMTRFDDPGALVEVLLLLLEYTGRDKAADIARRVNLKQIIVDKNLDSLTLFAPTNEAIQKWAEQVPAEQARDVQLLTQLAKAWVVPRKLALQQLSNEEQIPTLEGNVKLRVNLYDAQITVNGAKIVRLAEIENHNAVVNIIDKMIFPLPFGDLVAELKIGPFSKLIDLVQKAGLQDYIAKTDALTCFAPTDAAWARVPADKMAELVADKTKLQRLLKYHIVPSTLYSAGLRIKRNVESAAGERIAIAYDAQKDEYRLNADTAQPDLAPKLQIKDLPATNGVIQVIDKVLDLPRK